MAQLKPERRQARLVSRRNKPSPWFDPCYSGRIPTGTPISLFRVKTLTLLIFSTFLVGACSRRSATPTINPSSKPYRGVLEAALSEPGGTYSVPLGEVQIMSSAELQPGGGDSPKLGIHWLGVIEGARKKKLIEFTEVVAGKNSASERVRSFSIKPTERLLSLADKTKGRPNLVQITIFRAEITEIAQDVLYEGPLARTRDEYRLVVGKYQWAPTPECLELHGGLAQTVDAKFRAVLKIDPFNRGYSVVARDTGLIDQDSWASAHVQ